MKSSFSECNLDRLQTVLKDTKKVDLSGKTMYNIRNYVFTYYGSVEMKKEESKKSTERTKLTLSVTYEDKTKLKIIAAKRNTSISAMLREWIQENAKEAEI